MDSWIKRLFGYSHIPRVGYNPKSGVVADHCKTVQYFRTERLWPDSGLDNPVHRSISEILDLHFQVLPDVADPGISHNRHASNSLGDFRYAQPK